MICKVKPLTPVITHGILISAGTAQYARLTFNLTEVSCLADGIIVMVLILTRLSGT